MSLLAVKMKIPSCTLNRFAVMCVARSALSGRKAVRRVYSGCSGVLYSGWNPLLRNGREPQLSAGANSDRRMNDGTGKQGISREGPLRSITSPPFAGPVAFVNSGPLAHTHAAPTSTSPRSNTGAGLSTTPGASLLAPSFPHAPAPGPAGTSPTGGHSTDYRSQQQQQQQQQQLLPSQVPHGQSNASAGNAAQNADRFARHHQQSDAAASPSSADPLSHLLQGGLPTTSDGRPVRAESQEGRTAAGSARFDYGNVPQVQTQAPPLAAEPVRWSSPAASAAAGVGAGAGVVGQQDGFRERAAVVSPSSRAMPALPPPPGNYAAAPPVVRVQPLPPQEKTLDELVAEFLSSEAPPPPEALDETLALGSPDGWVAMLGQLARRRAWKRLVEISASMLVAHRGGGAPGLTAEQAMDLRLRRALGMLRLGRATEAVEAAKEAGQEAGQPPLAAVSVAARLAAAGAKSFCEGEAEDEALEELAALKSELEGITAGGSSAATSDCSASPSTEDGGALALTVEEATIWRRRVTSSLANAFVRRGNWRQALGLLEAIGEDQCSSAPRFDTGSTEEGTPTVEGGPVGGAGAVGEAAVSTFRVEVLSRIGRVFLQFGALKDAEVYLHRAEEASVSPDDSPRVLIDRGLHLFSKNEFVGAQESFRKAADAVAAEGEPPDLTVDTWLWATLDEGAGLLDSALNNLSLAMVYSCDVMRGVQTLEGLIRKDPRLYMLNVVVFNLCTLYDLSFDAVASAKKKRTLQAVARRFRLEDIDPSSFRMS